MRPWTRKLGVALLIVVPILLLYDGQSNLVTANTNVPALEGVSFRLGFKPADLNGMDFGEPLVPGAKCIPPR